MPNYAHVKNKLYYNVFREIYYSSYAQTLLILYTGLAHASSTHGI